MQVVHWCYRKYNIWFQTQHFICSCAVLRVNTTAQYCKLFNHECCYSSPRYSGIVGCKSTNNSSIELSMPQPWHSHTRALLRCNQSVPAIVKKLQNLTSPATPIPRPSSIIWDNSHVPDSVQCCLHWWVLSLMIPGILSRCQWNN